MDDDNYLEQLQRTADAVQRSGRDVTLQHTAADAWAAALLELRSRCEDPAATDLVEQMLLLLGLAPADLNRPWPFRPIEDGEELKATRDRSHLLVPQQLRPPSERGLQRRKGLY